MKKLLVLLLFVIPVLLIIFANVVNSAPPGEPGALLSFQPVITLVPHPSFLPLDLIVEIPDTALHAALHTKTGIPNSQPIHSSDLKALTGTLDLHELGISSAEGLQYCKNVEKINLENNHLKGNADMPDFSGMTKLYWLILNGNDFTTVPSQLFETPKLEYLEMHGCPITGVDEYISDMQKLRELDLSDTDMNEFPTSVLALHDLEILSLDDTPIKAIPGNIDHMTNLEELSLQNTGLKSLPSSISGLTHLNRLNVSHNKLESLPGSICSLHLGELNASYNDLYELPAHIGDHIAGLMVHCNRLTSIPQSIISSPVMDMLNIMANRLTSLPSGFAGKTFDGVNVEFNFIDMSPGSAAHEIMDDNQSGQKHFLRQLTPVKDLTADPSSDSVALSWDACPDGSGGGVTWTVKGYVVYQYTGEMVKISDVNKSHTSYTHTGLTPETDYSYRVGVDYRIIDPVLMIDYTNRGYTAADTATLAASAAATVSPVSSPSISPSDSAAVSPEASQNSLPAAEQTNAAIPADGSGFPIWAIIIAAVGALGIIGTGIALVVLKARKPKA